jgi:archaellum component FlaC
MRFFSQQVQETAQRFAALELHVRGDSAENANLRQNFMQLGQNFQDHAGQISAMRRENSRAMLTMGEHLSQLRERIEQVAQERLEGPGSDQRDSGIGEEQLLRVAQRVQETEQSMSDLCRDMLAQVNSFAGTKDQVGNMQSMLSQFGERLQTLWTDVKQVREEVTESRTGQLHLSQGLGQLQQQVENLQKEMENFRAKIHRENQNLSLLKEHTGRGLASLQQSHMSLQQAVVRELQAVRGQAANQVADVEGKLAEELEEKLRINERRIRRLEEARADDRANITALPPQPPRVTGATRGQPTGQFGPNQS